MSDAEVEEIRLGGVLHDIGKVAIPENILNKSGPLNPDEWDTMKSHVTFGAKILDPLTPLARIREMVLHHHEYFDGSGYPDALSGERFRWVRASSPWPTPSTPSPAIAPTRKPAAAAEALAELERCSNAQFDGASSPSLSAPCASSPIPSSKSPRPPPQLVIARG